MLGIQQLKREAWSAAFNSATRHYPIRKGPPIRMIGISLDFVVTVTANLPENSPELYIDRVTLTCDNEVRIDLTGVEMWYASMMQQLDLAHKNISTNTTPSCKMLLDFGPRFALDPSAYENVELTIAFGAIDQMTDLVITSGTVGVYTVEQALRPSGGSRRWLRQAVTFAATGEREIELDAKDVLYDSLTMIAADSAQFASTFAKDATEANIGNMRMSVIDDRGRNDITNAHWKDIKEVGLALSGTQQWDADSDTTFAQQMLGVNHLQLGEAPGSAVDLRGANHLLLVPYVNTASTLLYIVRNIIVPPPGV